MSENYEPRVTPWLIAESEFHELESHRDQMEFLLRCAVRVPEFGPRSRALRRLLKDRRSRPGA